MKISTKEIIKKIISTLLTVTLLIGMVNIPVYAKKSDVLKSKTINSVLPKKYYTPKQIVKNSKKSTKTTKKANTKKVKAKKTVKKKVSLTNKIIKKYTKKGLKALQALAKKFKIKLKTVYKQFVKYGVTKAQMKKVSSLLIKLVNRGVIFENCVSLAVSKYLGISRKSAALQNLAAHISIDENNFVSNYSHEKKVIGTLTYAYLKVLQKNGHKKAYKAEYKLNFFMKNLKVGEKAILLLTGYNTKNEKTNTHVVTVVREKKGYAVYNTLIDNGKKVLYTPAEFKKLMNGKRAIGKTVSGKKIKTKTVFNTSKYGKHYYKVINDNGKIEMTTDSVNLKKAEFISAYNLKGQSSAAINKLYNIYTKEYGKEVVDIICGFSKKFNLKLNSPQINKLFDIYARYTPEEGKKVIGIIIKLSEKFNLNPGSPTINKLYNIYTKDHGEQVTDLICGLSKKFNLDPITVYNQFVNNNVSNEDMQVICVGILKDIENNVNDIGFWISKDSNIYKALDAIKKLAK